MSRTEKEVIFYTTETGGTMKPTWGDEERYHELVAKGTIQERPDIVDHPESPLAMVAYATIVEIHDFRLALV